MKSADPVKAAVLQVTHNLAIPVIGYGPGGEPVYAQVPDECCITSKVKPDCEPCLAHGIGCARGMAIIRQRGGK